MSEIVGTKQELLLARIGGSDAARLVMALLSTARRIDAECAVVLSRYDLSEGRLAALLAISGEPGISPAALAERLAVTRATVTGLLDGLERQGFVSREGGAQDRRTLALRATEVGERVIDELSPVYSDWLGGLVADTGDEDRQATLRTMRAISTAIAQVGS